MVAFWLQNTYTYGRELSIILPAFAHLSEFTYREFTALVPCLPSLLQKKWICPPLPAQCESGLVQKAPLLWFY